jgi:hypothetical protein
LAAKAALTAIQTLTGQQTIQTSAAGNLGLIVKASTSQSADLQQWQNVGGGVITAVRGDGRFYSSISLRANGLTSPNNTGSTIGTGDASAVTILAGSASLQPLIVKGAASQSANLQEWQNSAGTVLARISSAGLLRTGDSVLANQYVGVVGTSSVTDTAALAGLQANTSLGGGWVQFKKVTSAVSNPGANFGNIYFRDGTTAGTLKLVVRAGAAGAETTILDNIPQ